MTKQQRTGRDTHIYLSDEFWEMLEAFAKPRELSITAAIRLLVREGLRQAQLEERITARKERQ
jgi:predicted DNA-binding ribbon-helix-helix protein